MIGYLAQNHPLVAAFRSLPKTRTRPGARLAQSIFKTAPKLGDYFRDGDFLAHKGDLDRPISGLAMDSRRVQPGNLFFALPGRRADGHAFIAEAIQRGAVAIVGEKIPAGTALRVTYLQVSDVRRTLAQVAQRYFAFPDKSVDLVAVTGRHGKTHRCQPHPAPAVGFGAPGGPHQQCPLPPRRPHRAGLSHYSRITRSLRSARADARCRLPAGGAGSQCACTRTATCARPELRRRHIHRIHRRRPLRPGKPASRRRPVC
jgi:hypothetical protein